MSGADVRREIDLIRGCVSPAVFYWRRVLKEKLLAFGTI
jgi:hypothetical protein